MDYLPSRNLAVKRQNTVINRTNFYALWHIEITRTFGASFFADFKNDCAFFD